MYDNAEFEAAVSDISDRVAVVHDPRHAAAVEQWLTKLTTGDRGANELHYIQLLQYMVANKRIGRPFKKPPPAGLLAPLGKHLHPRPPNPPPPPPAPPQRPQPSASSSSSSSCGFVTEDVTYSTDEVATTTDDEISDVSATISASSTTQSSSADVNRDGHLAGGGECASCWGPSSDGGAPKRPAATERNPVAKLCDPCLDDMGRHLRKQRPCPLDEAYRELLGECALPVLTEAEKKSVGPELLQVLQAVNESTTLQDFYFQVKHGEG